MDTSQNDPKQYENEVKTKGKKASQIEENARIGPRVSTHARNKRPLEGGWGWACVFGCAFVHFLSPGLVKSFGVTIIYIMDKFQCSSSDVIPYYP